MAMAKNENQVALPVSNTDKLLALLKIKRTPPSVRNRQPVIRLVIGEEKVEFFVHKNYLCYYSPYFAGALREGAFQESTNQTVELDHLDVEAFALFVGWLYSQSIGTVHGSREDLDADKPSWHTLVHCWILADYLQIPSLQNDMIDKILHKFDRIKQYPSLNLYPVIYENTGSGSMLRKLLVDLCIWKGFKDSEIYMTNKDCFPKDMLLEMAVASNIKMSTSADRSMVSPVTDSKNYHIKSDHGT